MSLYLYSVPSSTSTQIRVPDILTLQLGISQTVDHEKNYDIEALRAFAICLTLVAHLGNISPTLQPLVGYFWLGGGVDLFFAVSGYLICGSLLKSMDSSPTFSAYAFAFWVRRVFRLWPAAAFWSAIVVAVSWLGHASIFGDPEYLMPAWVAGLAQVQNIYQSFCFAGGNCKLTALGPYWSLSLEEQFYLLMPIVIFAIRNRKILACGLLAIAIPQFFTDRPYGTIWWFTRTDALIYGAVIAIVWHEWPDQIKRLPLWSHRTVITATILTLAAGIILISRPQITQFYMGFIAVFAGCITLLASADRRYLTQNARARTIAGYIGSRSYSIYLIHMPVYWGVHWIVGVKIGASMDSWPAISISALAATAIIFVLAEISVRRVETPLRIYGHTVSRRIGMRLLITTKSA